MDTSQRIVLFLIDFLLETILREDIIWYELFQIIWLKYYFFEMMWTFHCSKTLVNDFWQKIHFSMKWHENFIFLMIFNVGVILSSKTSISSPKHFPRMRDSETPLVSEMMWIWDESDQNLKKCWISMIFDRKYTFQWNDMRILYFWWFSSCE